jgi:hypothetical protein
MRKSWLLLAVFLVLPGQAEAKTPPKNEVAYRTIKVRDRRFDAPQITGYRNPAIAKSVNQQIAAVFEELGCERGTEGDESVEIRSSVKLAARDIFSVYISGSWYCGAYPENDGNDSRTFDLLTGKPVEFEALFANYDRDKRRILRTIFAKQVALSEKTNGKESPGGSCEDSPGLYDLGRLEESSFSFNLTPKGLEVEPAWSHANQACQERVTVPYKSLAKYWAPGGLLQRMASPRPPSR